MLYLHHINNVFAFILQPFLACRLSCIFYFYLFVELERQAKSPINLMYYGCKVGKDPSSVTDSCLSLTTPSASKSLQSALNHLPHCYAQATHKYYTNPTSRLLKLIFVVEEFEALKRVINKHRMRRVPKFNSSM